MFRPDGERNAAASGELSRHYGIPWRTRPHEVVQDSICHGLIECPDVPIGGEVKLQRLTFDTNAVRDVLNFDPGEICLPSNRAEGREVVGLEMDSILPSRGIWK